MDVDRRFEECWLSGGAGVIVRDFGRSLGIRILDFCGFDLTLVTEIPGMSENIWEDVSGRCGAWLCLNPDPDSRGLL